MGQDQTISISPRLILGLLVALVGALLLIENLGLLEQGVLGIWWPVAFVVLGAYQIVFGASPLPKAMGVGFASLGAALLYAHLNPEVVSAEEIWSNLWPVLLVVGGGWIVFRALRPHRPSEDARSSNDRVRIFTFWSGQDLAVNSTRFEGGELTSIMGGYELDLRDADMPEGSEAILDVFALMGGGEIRVPEDWTVISDVLPIMGGIDVKARTRPGAPDKRLRVKGFAMMGGVEIRN